MKKINMKKVRDILFFPVLIIIWIFLYAFTLMMGFVQLTAGFLLAIRGYAIKYDKEGKPYIEKVGEK